MLGKKHPHTLAGMENLWVTYLRQGRLREAEELGLRVLGLRKEVLGENHLDTLLAKKMLAITYSRLDQQKEAEELHLQVQAHEAKDG